MQNIQGVVSRSYQKNLVRGSNSFWVNEPLKWVHYWTRWTGLG